MVTGATSPLSIYGGSSGTSASFLILIALLVTVRVYRNTKGRRFTKSSIYFLPIIYLILTVTSIFEAGPSVADLFATAASLAAGLMIGLRIAGGVQFFDKAGVTYFKRSPVIMIAWLISFMARFGIETFYPAIPILGAAIEVILAATTGLIIGEAIHISRGYRMHSLSQKEGVTNNNQQEKQ